MSAMPRDPGPDRIVLLGTSAGPPIFAEPSHPASAVVVVGSRIYLVDCGLGVARQLVRAGLPSQAIRALLVTHHHLDHMSGYPELMLLAQGLRGVDVHGPPPLAQMHHDFIRAFAFVGELNSNAFGAFSDGAVDVHDLTLPEKGIVDVFEDEKVRVTATRVYHTARVADAYAYRIDRKRDGRAVVFSGDTTGPHLNLIELARGADILVHEVQLDRYVPAILEMTPLAMHEQLRDHFLDAHTEAADVPRVAAEAGVRMLVLNHYTPSFVPREEFEQAVRESADAIGWGGDIVAGADLEAIALDG